MCKNFGCNKRYNEENNADGACLHHCKPPVFHETRKFWSCCPDQIAWDWDSFQAIKGCTQGRHSSVAASQQFLGGTDVRAQQEEQLAQSTPQRIKTSLDKLSTLRKALIDIGVDGKLFDSARDAIKLKYENEGSKAWDLVAENLGKHLEQSLSQI